MEEAKAMNSGEREPPKAGKLVRDSFRMTPAYSVAILLIVVAAIFFYSWTRPFIRSDKEAPEYSLDCYQISDGNFIVDIIETDPNDRCCYQVDYIIADEQGDVIQGGGGSVRSIYGADLLFEGSSDHQSIPSHSGNVSFADNDVDRTISAGDRFIVRSVENGGIARDGFEFKLKFFTDDIIGTVTFDSQNTMNRSSYNISGNQSSRSSSNDGQNQSNRYSPYQSILCTITQDHNNISMEYGRSVLDRFRYYANGNGLYNFSWTYIGTEERNITVSLLLDGHVIRNYSLEVTTNDHIWMDGNFTFGDSPYWEEIEQHNLTVQVVDEPSNMTLYHGFVRYAVVGLSGCCPSFLHSPLFQFVTVGILISTVSFQSWRTNNNPRKHK